MGYETAELRVTARLSDHHDERDEQDRDAWKSFKRAVRDLAARSEYADVVLDVDG